MVIKLGQLIDIGMNIIFMNYFGAKSRPFLIFQPGVINQKPFFLS